MTLSAKAWRRSSKIIEAIENHPFNQELMNGTLSVDRFAYYIEQDKLYLKDFAKSLAIIASKLSIKYARNFLHYSEAATAEQKTLHGLQKVLNPS